MLLKHIVVGWHRGGLGYAGQFLSLCGCKVGYTFGTDVTRKNLETKLKQARAIEVSPWLVPYLGHPLLKDIPVTFVLRDPMRVFNSLVHFGHFQPARRTEVERFVFNHSYDTYSQYAGKPLQAPAAYMINWFNLAKQLVPNLKTIQVEHFPHFALSHFNLDKANVPYLEPTLNASEHYQALKPASLPDKIQETMRQLLKRAGYMYDIPAPYSGHPHFMNTDWHY